MNCIVSRISWGQFRVGKWTSKPWGFLDSNFLAKYAQRAKAGGKVFTALFKRRSVVWVWLAVYCLKNTYVKTLAWVCSFVCWNRALNWNFGLLHLRRIIMSRFQIFVLGSIELKPDHILEQKPEGVSKTIWIDWHTHEVKPPKLAPQRCQTSEDNERIQTLNPQVII